jgi:hypothetical protein
MVIIKFICESKIPVNFTGVIINGYVKIFIKNSKYHRIYGPSLIWIDKDKYWYFNGKNCGNSTQKYNQKEFIKILIDNNELHFIR